MLCSAETVLSSSHVRYKWGMLMNEGMVSWSYAPIALAYGRGERRKDKPIGKKLARARGAARLANFSITVGTIISPCTAIPDPRAWLASLHSKNILTAIFTVKISTAVATFSCRSAALQSYSAARTPQQAVQRARCTR